MTQTATKLAAEIRSGRVSSREVTEQLLARIAADTTVNAVVETRPEYAVRAAAVADELVAAGRETGPLHGVPMTIKEAFAVAGMHSTWGSRMFGDPALDWDATVADRLTAAGAIIVGKTNVHAMLADFGQTVNEVYGRTSNPIDPSLVPGGSSGGSAAALAAGLTYLEYGSDLVGSIRLPAAYCGVYGLKPTAGVVPLRGLQPPGEPQVELEFPTMSNVGPLATSAADLRTALRVTGGPAVPSAYSWQLRPPRHRRLADYRVGVVLDHPAARVSAEVGEVLSGLVDRIAASGATIVDGWPAGVDPVEQAEEFGFQVGTTMAAFGDSTESGDFGEVLAHERRRMELRASWQRYFDDIDVFLCPTSFTTAFPHDDRPFDQRTITTSYGEQRYDAQVFWIAHATLTGLPALSMPAGVTRAGLPVGAQVIGPWHEDDTAITFAELAGMLLD